MPSAFFRVVCLVLLLMSAGALNAAPAVAGSCESLASMSLPNTTITKAEAVAAGALTIPAGRGGGSISDLPAFCRVEIGRAHV